MIYSMTGFARAELSGEQGTLTWEIRSLNHRYLEITMRMPEEFRALETAFREKIKGVLNRGKVECNLKFRPNLQNEQAIQLNRSLMSQLGLAIQSAQKELGTQLTVNATDFLQWPGILQETETDLAPIHKAADQCLGDALKQLQLTRAKEGEAIASWIEARCDKMQALSEDAGRKMPEILDKIRDRIRARLVEIMNEVDHDRIEQEMVIIAQKLDVDEELDRLQNHIREVKDVLTRNEPVGRRLDFLMQELNREANTLGSKSADTEITNISVELKVLIEQMREQVQNTE